MKDRLNKLIANLFDCDVTDLSDETGPGDLKGWDSLGHVALMAAIQEEFGMHVPVEDAIEVESISDLIMLLERLREYES